MKKVITGLLVTGALLTGCASNTITDNKYSGFLSDYSILKPTKEDPGRIGYLDLDVNWQQYHGIMVSWLTKSSL